MKAECRITSGEDKYRIGLAEAQKTRARSVGLVLEDYDDLKLLSLSGVVYVAYHNRLSHFIPHHIQSESFKTIAQQYTIAQV